MPVSCRAWMLNRIRREREMFSTPKFHDAILGLGRDHVPNQQDAAIVYWHPHVLNAHNAGFISDQISQCHPWFKPPQSIAIDHCTSVALNRDSGLVVLESAGVDDF